MVDRSFISIDNFSISYLEKNTSAKKLIFFFHGNSNSAELWRYQFSDPLFDDYRLIAFDLPAHGKSILPDDPEKCSLLCFGEIFSKCLDRIAGDLPYILCGLSLGGNVISELLAYKDSALGLILIGANLAGDQVTPEDIISDPLVTEVLFTNLATSVHIKQYLQLASLSGPDQNWLYENYLSVDSRFRVFFPSSIQAGNYSDEIGLLRQFKRPVLIIFGDKDVVGSVELMKGAATDLWKEKIIMIPDAGHLAVLDQPVVFNRLLSEFLSEVF